MKQSDYEVVSEVADGDLLGGTRISDGHTVNFPASLLRTKYIPTMSVTIGIGSEFENMAAFYNGMEGKTGQQLFIQFTDPKLLEDIYLSIPGWEVVMVHGSFIDYPDENLNISIYQSVLGISGDFNCGGGGYSFRASGEGFSTGPVTARGNGSSFNIKYNDNATFLGYLNFSGSSRGGGIFDISEVASPTFAGDCAFDSPVITFYPLLAQEPNTRLCLSGGVTYVGTDPLEYLIGATRGNTVYIGGTVDCGSSGVTNVIAVTDGGIVFNQANIIGTKTNDYSQVPGISTEDGEIYAEFDPVQTSNSTSGSVAIEAGKKRLNHDAASVAATLTLECSNILDGTGLIVRSVLGVTALTISGSGLTVFGAPSGISAGSIINIERSGSELWVY